MFSGSSLLLCQPAPSRTRTQWFPGCTEALARCSFMDAVLACDVADREHPFCTRGSEKIDVTVAVVASDPRAAVLACPQPCQHSLLANSTLVLKPGRSADLVGPYYIFHNVLKILTKFLLILGLRLNRTRRNMTKAQPLHQSTCSFHGILDAEVRLDLVLYVLNAPANQPVSFRAFLQRPLTGPRRGKLSVPISGGRSVLPVRTRCNDGPSRAVSVDPCSALSQRPGDCVPPESARSPVALVRRYRIVSPSRVTLPVCSSCVLQALSCRPPYH